MNACGCRLDWSECYDPGNSPAIVYCPLHAAAFRLAAALRVTLDHGEAVEHHPSCDECVAARALLREIGR